MFLVKFSRDLGQKVLKTLRFLQSNRNFDASNNTSKISSIEPKMNSTLSHIDQNKVKGFQLKEQLSKHQHEFFKINGVLIRCSYMNKPQHKVDFYMRIFKTPNTITYLPSTHYLQKLHNNQQSQSYYDRDEDKNFQTYKCKCSKCGTSQVKSATKNGLEYGVVISECEQCDQIMVLADNMNWFDRENLENKMGKENIVFERAKVDRIIERDLQEMKKAKGGKLQMVV